MLTGLLFPTEIFLAIVGLWTLVWKGFALWKSARNKQNVWFVCLLLFNTMGLLAILYIFLFQKRKE